MFQVSYLGFFIGMLLTGCGLPIPEEVFIIGAGIAAHSGYHWYILLPVLVAGGLLGDMIMYSLGRFFGKQIFSHPHISHHLTPEREAKMEEKLKQHGFTVMFFSRFLIGVRSSVYITAGILKMSPLRFFINDLIAASVIIPIFFGLAYYFGEAIKPVLEDAELTLTIIVVPAVIIVAIIFWRRHKKKVAEARQKEMSEMQEEEKDGEFIASAKPATPSQDTSLQANTNSESS